MIQISVITQGKWGHVLIQDGYWRAELTPADAEKLAAELTRAAKEGRAITLKHMRSL